jgi:hypothetical protein
MGAASVLFFDQHVCKTNPKYSEIILIAVSVSFERTSLCYPGNEPEPPRLESGNDPPGLRNWLGLYSLQFTVYSSPSTFQYCSTRLHSILKDYNNECAGETKYPLQNISFVLHLTACFTSQLNHDIHVVICVYTYRDFARRSTSDVSRVLGKQR